MATISEERRIAFTRQILELRDDVVDHLSFTSDLSNEERKFIHKISQDYGLKSKSAGKGDNRFITVRKNNGAAQERKQSNKTTVSEPLSWVPDAQSLKLLLDPSLSQHSLDAACLPSSSDVLQKKLVAVESRREGPRVSVKQLAASHMKAQARRRSNANYSSLQQKRQQLPAYEHRATVLSVIQRNQIVLISGETGCGKSTQVPQYLLDDEALGPHCRIAITQPRRISAVAVAERISFERGEPVGQTVGYNIRLESQRSDNTQVMFMTPGVLLRKLLADPLLEEYTHVVVDEAHERDRFTEFLLIILRDICRRRADLKLVLMSATMHTDKLRAYFGDIPAVTVGGSVFPVQEFFLEHVLRMTDHLGDGTAAQPLQRRPPRDGAKAVSYGRAAPRAKIATIAAPEFRCYTCGAGPFCSPVELGAHSAFCFPGSGSSSGGSSQQRTEPQHQGGSLMEKINFLRLSQAKPTPVLPPPPIVEFSADVELAEGAEEEQEELTADGADEEGEEGEDSAYDLCTAAIEGPGADHAGEDEEEDEVNRAALDALVAAYQEGWEDSQVDCALVVSLLEHIFLSAGASPAEGSVLVFLPGWDDINRLHRVLSTHSAFGNGHVYKLLQLHSSVPKKEQDRVFLPLGRGEHKIILSTNIAETSITIDDVTAVINTGRVKEKTYDPHTKLAYLQSAWISQASARQRRGRAGRTQSGVCYHLYSRLRARHLSGFQDSELLRMPLEELVLQAKILGVAPGRGDEPDSVRSFLLKAMDPPHPLAVQNGIQLLCAIGCLTADEDLTLLGQAVSALPMNPRMGRMILLGCLLGVGPAVTTAASAMGYKDPFIMANSDQQRIVVNQAKARLGMNCASDQVLALKAVQGFQALCQRSSNFSAGAYRYCDDHCLSHATVSYMTQLVAQLRGSLGDVGIDLQAPLTQRCNGDTSLVLAVIGTGLYPDVGVRREGSTVYATEKGCKAKIHPSSINARSPLLSKECRRPVECLGFQDLISTPAAASSVIRGANLQMLSTTPLSVFSVLLSCGQLRELGREWPGDDSDSEEDETDRRARRAVLPLSQINVTVELDGWLVLKLRSDHLQLVLGVRAFMTAAMVQFVRDPSVGLAPGLARAVDSVAKIMSIEHAKLAVAAPAGASTAGSENSSVVHGRGGGGGSGGRGSGGGGTGQGRGDRKPSSNNRR